MTDKTETYKIENAAAPASLVGRLVRQNAGKYWTPTEIDILIEQFKDRKHPNSIAEAHGRTAAAIIVQLTKLGLVVIRGKGYHRVEPTQWVSFTEIQNA